MASPVPCRPNPFIESRLMPLLRPDAAVDRIVGLPRGGGAIRPHIRGRVLEILIDHPQAAGAVSPGMMVDLVSVVDTLPQYAGWPVVVHSSAPRAFCAGGDLRSVRAHLMENEAASAMVDVLTWALDRLSAHSGVVLAAVEGPALGGGAEFLTACDHLVLSTSARVGFVHASLGVSPGWGGAGRLVRRVGRRHALMWLADPRPRSAEACARMGMADQVVPAGAALESAQGLAADLARSPEGARAAVAALVKGGAETERATFLRLWGGADHLAALAAVRAGR
ncbi:MAG TPA: hypothetical protein DFR83_20540 [Deltaproteobacteria bacterium]|nr:hypothetical protein [Deltaproteobacteria bacterium]